jgi:hypothetical protein
MLTSRWSRARGCRAAIADNHRKLLQTRYIGSKSLPMRGEAVRFLAPTIAIAHVTSGASFLWQARYQ